MRLKILAYLGWEGRAVTGPTYAFRSSFRRLWRLTTVMIGGFNALAYLAAPPGLPWDPALGVAVSLGILAVFAAAVLVFPVYVTPTGIRSYGESGLYKTIPWAEVGDVCPTCLFGLRYLVVRPASGWAGIHVPLDLSDMAGFEAAVVRYAGRDHPLAAAVREYA